MTFTLYSDEGSTSVWSEEVPVNFVGGYFTVYLGETVTLDLATFRDNGSPHLGIKVANDEEMTPFALSTSPFSGFAQYAGFAADITDAAKVQIVGDVAVQLDNDGKVHDKYTDAEAIAAVTGALANDTAQLEAALGAEGDSNPLNHARYTNAEAQAVANAQISAHASTADAHHAKYTDTEAIAAVTGSDIVFTSSVTANAFNGAIIPRRQDWDTQGRGFGGAGIYNDGGSYRSLMVVGNDSAGGQREVGLWDNATIHGNLTVEGDIQFTTTHGSGYSELIAQATCTAIRSGGGRTRAVPRTCGGSTTCASICAGISGTPACFDALHVYERTPAAGDHQAGLETFRYGGCANTNCGPNFCCCSN